MTGIAGWLIANLFLLALALVGAGIMFVLLWLLRAADLSSSVESFLSLFVALGAVIGTYYVGKLVYDFIERPRKR